MSGLSGDAIVPHIRIGIVTFNSVGDLPSLFDSLRRLQGNFSLDIVVFDNASSDGSADWVETHAPEARLIRSDANIGFGRGHNAILRRVSTPYDFYMPLNPDVILMPDYLAVLLETRQKTGADWGIGKLLLQNADGQPTQTFYSAGQGVRRDGFSINTGEGMIDTGQFDVAREIMVCTGAAPLITWEMVEIVSDNGDLFDRNMFMYGEDIEMGWRARRAGLRFWYEPRAVAYHRGSSPRGGMRATALGNQYLAILKNAYLLDLLFYNSPLMIFGWAARMILSPRMGIAIARQMIASAPDALRKRRKPRISRTHMSYWFRWTTLQPTAQTTTLIARVKAYLRRDKSAPAHLP